MSTLKTNKVQSVTTSDLTLDTASTSKRIVIPSTTGDDVDLDALSGRLIIGNIAGSHLAIDENEIKAKSNTTTATTLYLHRDGGVVSIGSPLVIDEREDDVANGGAISLATHASLFVTGGAETSTLAAGTEGQIKVLAMHTDGGDMVVTVTNAGWKGSGTGTITFNAIGDCCILQYLNSKWFMISENTVTTA
jgi:hypothetical protein